MSCGARVVAPWCGVLETADICFIVDVVVGVVRWEVFFFWPRLTRGASGGGGRFEAEEWGWGKEEESVVGGTGMMIQCVIYVTVRTLFH